MVGGNRGGRELSRDEVDRLIAWYRAYRHEIDEASLSAWLGWSPEQTERYLAEGTLPG